MTSLTYKRVLLKISGEILGGNKESGLDMAKVEELCKEIAQVQQLGVEIALVVGGGNFWRYRDFAQTGLDRVRSDYMGMLATVMNASALVDTFTRQNIKAKTLSSFEVPLAEVFQRDKALEYLKDGYIVICAGGTGSPFFTTDTTAALRALELNCEVVLKATKVDYVYDKDPVQNPDAKAFEQISYQEILERQLGFMDLTAVSLCAANKLPLQVFNLLQKGNIEAIIKGEKTGTLIN